MQKLLAIHDVKGRTVRGIQSPLIGLIRVETSTLSKNSDNELITLLVTCQTKYSVVCTCGSLLGLDTFAQS